MTYYDKAKHRHVRVFTRPQPDPLLPGGEGREAVVQTQSDLAVPRNGARLGYVYIF